MFRARIEASAGINRYRWKLRFDPPETARAAFRKRMERIFKDLEERAERVDRTRIGELRERFRAADTPDEWNDIRRILAREFRGLATGYAYFGPDLEGPTAGPGVYRVILAAGGEEARGVIRVREDPFLKDADSFFPIREAAGEGNPAADR